MHAYNHEVSQFIAKFVDDMLNKREAALSVIDSANCYPDCGILQIFAATINLYGQTDACNERAASYLSKAESYKNQFTEYECLLFNACKVWLHKDYHQTIKVFKQALANNPHDLLSLKYAEWLYYIVGQAQYADEFCNLCESIKEHNIQSPCFLSIYSFALELAGRREESLRIAKKSLDKSPRLTWAQHTVAHAYLLQGEIDKCINILKKSENDWQSSFQTLQSHMHWHLSLAYIAKSDKNAAIDIFKQKIWTGDKTNQILVQLDSISLLWRLDILGSEHPELWPDIIEKMRNHCTSPYTTFNTTHFVYASAKNNLDDLATEIIRKATAYSNTQTDLARYSWKNIGLPCFHAIQSYTKQDYQQALLSLSQCIDNIGYIGGSDAEIELFHMLYCKCLAQAGHQAESRSHFNKYLAHYKSSIINTITAHK